MWKMTSRTIQTSCMSETAQVPLWRIALSFNQIALASFGGGLSAWSRQMVVDQRHWMTDEEFLSAMTVCRVLPGANQVNLAVFVGARLRGVPGAIVATTGLLAAPMLIVLVLGALYIAHRSDASVQAVLRGMTAAAVAMSLSMAYRTGRTCLHSPIAWALFVAALVASAVVRLPLLIVLLVLAPLAMWWAWPRRRRAVS
jgi:chromate transporter